MSISGSVIFTGGVVSIWYYNIVGGLEKCYMVLDYTGWVDGPKIRFFALYNM